MPVPNEVSRGGSPAGRGEARWPMALAVLIAGILRATLPPELRNGDARWLFLALLAALLGTLIIGDPGRIDRDLRWLRILTSTLIGVITVADADATIRLVVSISTSRHSRTMPRSSWPAAGPSG